MNLEEHQEIEQSKTLFECNHINERANYNLIKEGLGITPQNAITSNFKLKLIACSDSPYGFAACCLRGDKWEYSGFGDTGACSVVVALLKELQKTQQEFKEVSKIRDNNFVHAFELRQKLKQVKKLATERNYLDLNECLDDILNVINQIPKSE